MKNKERWLFLLFGVITGFLNGFFGGGGGMVVLPLLTIILKIEQKVAHATAIAIMLPTSIISAIIYFFTADKNIITINSISIIAGVIVGGIIGAIILKKINNKTLVKIFAWVMLVAGAKLLFF